jgi:hypothetical protein
MITEPGTTDLEYTDAPQANKDFMTGYYDGKTQEIKYVSFISDVRDICATNGDKILHYISNDLTKIYKDPNYEKSISISFVNTDDQNVKLMQEKLYTLGTIDETLEGQSFYNERSYSISTFRTLFSVAKLIREMNTFGLGNDDHLVNILLDEINKQTTSGAEEDFRRPVYNSRDILLCKSKDADMRKTHEYMNPEGKVTKIEMATVILPRIKKILENITRVNPTFKF